MHNDGNLSCFGMPEHGGHDLVIGGMGIWKKI